MDLKDFVKKALQDITTAVDEVSADSSRKMVLAKRDTDRTVEFDVAVTVEETGTVAGGIKILNIIGAGISADQQNKNSTVTRIQFGVDVAYGTRVEEAAEEAAAGARRAHVHYPSR